MGEFWAKEGRKRCIRGGGTVEEYKKINAQESAALAQAFVSEKFIRFVKDFTMDTSLSPTTLFLLRTQLEMLEKRGKSWSGTAFLMWLMLKTRFIWIRFL